MILIDPYNYMRLDGKKKKYAYSLNMFILPFWQSRVKNLQQLEEEVIFRFLNLGASID